MYVCMIKRRKKERERERERKRERERERKRERESDTLSRAHFTNAAMRTRVTSQIVLKTNFLRPNGETFT